MEFLIKDLVPRAYHQADVLHNLVKYKSLSSSDCLLQRVQRGKKLISVNCLHARVPFIFSMIAVMMLISPCANLRDNLIYEDCWE